MKPALRRVPWVRPSPEYHRPSRRVRPIRVPAVWGWTPETMSERWEALCFRSRFWRAVNGIGIALLYAAGLLWVVYLLFAEGRP